MRRLIVLRHAQSAHHVSGLTGGWTDTPLTELGHEQAARLAGRCRTLLANCRDIAVFSSDLLRAAQTAEIVGHALGVPIVHEPALRELNNGIAAGRSVADASALELPKTEPIVDWLPYPGAESWGTFSARVNRCLDTIAALGQETLVIVTHGGVGDLAAQWWLRLCEPCRGKIAFALDVASISILGTNDWGERTVVCWNDTSHLSPPNLR